MKIVKRGLKVAVVAMALLATKATTAQVDVKMNLLGAAFNDYGLYGEYGISESMSVQLGVMYNRTTMSITSDVGGINEERVYSGVKVIPSFRFYFSPDDPLEGFFVEPYIRYKTQSWDGGKANIPVDNAGNYDPTWNDDNTTWGGKYETREYKVNRTKAGFGVAMGKKWVHESGFLFEGYFGFGRNTPTREKYSDKDVQDYYDKVLTLEIPINVHFRAGVSLGWRF